MTVPYRDCEGLKISSVALGTYMGVSDDETDTRLEAVVLDAVNRGISYIDCAANYRCGRSERTVGRALASLANPFLKPLVIGTKAGFLPYDDNPPEVSDAEYFQTRYIDAGIVKPEWVVGDWQCYHPEYLEWQFNESLQRLQRRTIDIFYLHNPESMILCLEMESFRQTMREAFSWCMAKVRSGQLLFFGISTWGGLLGLSQGESLSLAEIYKLAESVGGRDHFKFIQAPFSAGLTHALTRRTQIDQNGRPISLLRLTAELGLHFIGSAPLLHGELLRVDCPKEIRALFPWPSVTQSYLDFSRSCPGVTTAIVGTTNPSHLQEAIELLCKEPSPVAFRELFRR